MAAACRLGWGAFLFYLAAFVYYLYVRIRYTIRGLGSYEVYGIVLLVIEVLGGTTVVLFGSNLLWEPLHEKYPPEAERQGVPMVRAHLRTSGIVLQAVMSVPLEAWLVHEAQLRSAVTLLLAALHHQHWIAGSICSPL